MDVYVNGKSISVPEDCNLISLLKQLSLADNRIAVELNREIVPRSQYNTLGLKNGDQLEIVQAIGGG